MLVPVRLPPGNMGYIIPGTTRTDVVVPGRPGIDLSSAVQVRASVDRDVLCGKLRASGWYAVVRRNVRVPLTAALSID